MIVLTAINPCGMSRVHVTRLMSFFLKSTRAVWLGIHQTLFFECKTHQFYFFRQQGSFSLLVEARHRQGKDTTFVSSISMVIPRGLARLSTPSLNFRISVLSSYGMHASRPVRLMMSASCRADGVCDNLYENGVLMMTRIKIYLRPTIKGHCGTREVISRIQIL